jgi:RNA polymerase-binding transcription factor DksA
MKDEIAPITAARRETLRARMTQRAEVLRREISAGLHSGDLDVPADEREVGDLNASVGVAAVQRDTDELRDIEDALLRMEAGRYGLCLDCGAALPWTRLDAQPQAGRCVPCESARERGHARAASL